MRHSRPVVTIANFSSKVPYCMDFYRSIEDHSFSSHKTSPIFSLKKHDSVSNVFHNCMDKYLRESLCNTQHSNTTEICCIKDNYVYAMPLYSYNHNTLLNFKWLHAWSLGVAPQQQLLSLRGTS